jgi:acetyl esterase/lipase
MLFFGIIISTGMSCTLFINSFIENRIDEQIKILADQDLPENITAIHNISYMQDGAGGHHLDIYYPDDSESPLPVIINIHGGGFIFGDKDLRLLYCYNLAKEGYIVYNINYRIATRENTDIKLPAQIIDVSYAMSWIYDNFDNFPANKEKIYLTGDSAGAYLATMAALISKSRRLQGIFETAEIKMNINALGLVSGYMKIEDTALPNSAIRPLYLDTDHNYDYLSLNTIPETHYLPPVFMTTNNDDEFDYMTCYFEEILKENDVIYQLYIPQKRGRKLGHIFNVLHLDWEESIVTNKKMLEFFSNY